MSRQRSRPKHIPQRTCVVCREKYDKRQLTRIVNTAEDGVVIDLSGKRNGRGAYLCAKAACWAAAAQGKALDQALKTVLTQEERAVLAAGPVSRAGTNQQPA
ncbi:MAG: YlxR family protein [Anaerolineales bacterium]|nr:YlxR family protein [Anaerolineales bacterium]MCB0005998.1 YlxR family protein [Anaerolineales bacterium]MCB0011190.1 YlxR family protein [Anaerolineales bacterium]MCB0019111.1 YlxR family protein [Anaerolineales bacterium]MCB0028599.1 YlxR family protein [Anaerolineales bacterium]